jgi:hypothetical protein
MITQNDDTGWQVKLIEPRLPWGNRPARPAELAENLSTIMLASENLLEDAEYNKIIPNQYVVEINRSHHARFFQPIEKEVLQQWQSQLLERINIANSRQGRNEYRLAGPLLIEIRPVEDLSPVQVRVLYRFQAAEKGPGPEAGLPACIKLLLGGRTWPLRPGITTIGRAKDCVITLDMPVVREKRLISSRHAYLLCEPDRYRIFDGSPDGKPSLNGTFVNYQLVGPEGRLLQDGDIIILAAVDPRHPQTDTPGIVALRFDLDCS